MANTKTHDTKASSVDYVPNAEAVALSDQASVSKLLIETHSQLVEALTKLPPKTGPQTVQDLELGHTDDLASRPLLVGVAIGLGADGTDFRGLPGETSLRIYVSEEVRTENVAEFVGAAFGINALSEGQVPYKVIHTGPIDLFAHRMRMRPAPCGISIGHYNITAGTLGCLARGRQSPRDALTLMVSNNHVLADVNAGQPRDPIMQPGPHDGGTQPQDVIAHLERVVKIDFARPNYVDCATASVVDPNVVRREQFYMKAGTPIFFPCGTTPVQASIGLTVGKSGRTTQLTAGRVTGVGATIRVNMGWGRVALFRDQVEIRGLSGDFSQPGDSGSLVWTWDDAREPVGLLFAGGGGLTFANPMHHVLAALDIDLI
jgi:hypothetical protein